MKRLVKNAAKSLLVKLFHVGQRFGVDILPRHFYSEIPDIGRLKQSKSWKLPYSMMGVAGTDPDEQLAFVQSVVTPRLSARLAQGDVHRIACSRNGEDGYGPIEADFLFAFMTTLRPRRVLQIGCGVSTAVCLMATQESGYNPEIICVEPYPTPFLTEAGAAKAITLIPQAVENLDPSVVDPLESGDLFFVDSSHTLGPAGEVTRIMVEMLPRLNAGVRVHFHDIYFPYDYPRDLLSTASFFTHESALLHGFLALNTRFRLTASLSMLHYARPAELGALLLNYRPGGNDHGLATTPGHFPSATYLEVTHPIAHFPSLGPVEPSRQLELGDS